MPGCTLIVYNDSPIPWGKLNLYEKSGRIYWKWIPLDQGGSVRTGHVEKRGNNYVLIKSDTNKEFGTVVNFSLYNYNANIRYTIRCTNGSLTCKVEPEYEQTF